MMRKPDPSGCSKNNIIGDSTDGNNKKKLKKGLWSPEEDEKLICYMLTNGQGSWSDVARNAGLQRCGKSCRLRWINYLRPDLKRGAFSPQEEELIIRLHSLLGNRWSQIAARLPGRTDNEIKNFWNSTIKKRLKNLSPTNSSSYTSDLPPSSSSLDLKDFTGRFMPMITQEQGLMMTPSPSSLQVTALNHRSTNTYSMLEHGLNRLDKDGSNPYEPLCMPQMRFDGEGFYGESEILGNLREEWEFYFPPLDSVSSEDDDWYKVESANDDGKTVDTSSFVINRLDDNNKAAKTHGTDEKLWIEQEDLRMGEWCFEELMNEVPSLFFNFKPNK